MSILNQDWERVKSEDEEPAGKKGSKRTEAGAYGSDVSEELKGALDQFTIVPSKRVPGEK